jgi:hypothetical protein
MLIKADASQSLPAWFQGIGAIATAAALIIGGIWALFRFRRARVFKPRCSIHMNCSVSSNHGRASINVDVGVSNCGDSNVVFKPLDKARIEVTVLEIDEWQRSGESQFVEWAYGGDWRMRQDFLASEIGRLSAVELEPGQDTFRSCLFMMPANWAAAQVRCRLTTGEGIEKREWISTRVVVRNEQNRVLHGSETEA